MTLFLSLLLFNVGFLLGTWWATHVARQKAEASASRPRLRNPIQRTPPSVPVHGYDAVASQN